jgi:hypothetical protein
LRHAWDRLTVHRLSGKYAGNRSGLRPDTRAVRCHRQHHDGDRNGRHSRQAASPHTPTHQESAQVHCHPSPNSQEHKSPPLTAKDYIILYFLEA